MTDAELLSLYSRRQVALKATNGKVGRNLPFKDMGEEQRRKALENSREFRETDRLIVAELRRRNCPAVLGTVTLHLTGDGLNFVTLSTATGRLVFGCKGSKSTGAGILYRYPREGARPRSPARKPGGPRKSAPGRRASNP